MFEECAPPTPVARLLGCSGFGIDVDYAEAADSDDIQEITFLGGCLMWNDASVCGGSIRLKIFMSVWSDMWKFREREYAMIFSIPLMCCEYRDVLLLTRVHPIQRDTESCNYMFTGSKDSL